jgi:hypothetical protein
VLYRAAATHGSGRWQGKWHASPEKAIKQAAGWKDKHSHLHDVYAQNERGDRIEIEDFA